MPIKSRGKTLDLIAVDIGNSRITCAQFRTGQIQKIWHHATSQALQAAQDIEQIAGHDLVSLCSVVPQATAVICKHLQSHGVRVSLIETGQQRIIGGIYPTMGADRIATAVAAWKQYGQKSAVAVIDAGTATTLAIVSAAGEFLGGFITLGLGSTLSALNKGTAQLPDLEMSALEKLPIKPGTNTPDSMAAGTLSGHLGLVQNWLEIADSHAPGNIKILTGGWSKVISVHSRLFDIVDPDLILKGIYFMAAEAADQEDRG